MSQVDLIARYSTLRDTDQDWTEIAKSEPFFGVLSQPEFFRSNLTAEALDKFWASGRQDIAWQLDLLRSHYGEFSPQTAIDFGCGVGRLTRAMAEIADHVYGVDVAPAMLEEARKLAPANISFVDLIPDMSVDWINSLIVFQHIPPERGVVLLQTLLERLKPQGCITIHVTIFKSVGTLNMKGAGVEFFRWDGNGFKTLLATLLPKGGMTMYDYDFNQVIAILCQGGIRRFTLQHTDHGGHHGVIIIGRKD